MQINWVVRLLVLLLLGLSSAAAEQIRFERLFTELGYQSVGPVSDIVQDKQGFIWLAGESGVGRYNGKSLKYYGLNNSTVWDIYVDQEQTLWFATDKGLARYDERRDTFTVWDSSKNALAQDLIYRINQNSEGQLMLATQTGLNIFDPKTETFEYYPLKRSNSEDVEGSLNTVFDVLEDSSGRVWLATAQLGLALFSPESGSFRFFTNEKNNPQSISYNSVKTLVEDHEQKLWLGTYGGGISYFDPETETFKNYIYDIDDPNSPPSNTVWHVFQDSKDSVWFATDAGGLARYRPETDDFVSFQHDPIDSSSLVSNVARVVFEDNRGDLWVGAFPAGVSYFNRSTAVFENYTFRPDDTSSLSHNAVLSVEEANDGTIWVGTEGGFNRFDKSTKTFKRYTQGIDGIENLHSEAILTLKEDHEGKIWVGTWSGGLHRFDPETETLQDYYDVANYPATPNSLFIWDIVQDELNNFWIATETGGLNHYDFRNQRFTAYMNDPNKENTISGNFARSVLVDRQGLVWVGTQTGLDSFDRTSKTFTHYNLKEKLIDPEYISDSVLRARALIEDEQGRIWLGTNDDGVYIYDRQNERSKHISTHNGLSSPYVASIVEDHQGIVWLGTTDGMVRVDPRSWRIKNFHKGHGLVGNSINRDSSFVDSEGLLYIGTTEGLSIINPRLLEPKPYDFPVKITGFKIFNKEVHIDRESDVLTENIVLNPSITLTHDLNMFEFEFAALTYRSPERNTYSYTLEGFDSEWHDVGSRNSATYTNLSAGTYVFKVRAADSDGVWSSHIAKQAVVVLPPPWRTWWAYTLYVLLIVSVVTLYIRAQQAKIAHEREVNERLRQLDKMKDDFLANTSHELRTPLNGIIGIADSLVDGAAGEVSEFLKSNLRMISVSGRRLANLVNDILDFSKSRNNSLSIHPKPLSIYEAAEMVVTFCEPSFGKSELQIVNQISPELPAVFADENRLQQILYNLIGNAVKFTEKGQITLEGEQRGDMVWISVVDTGCGIPQDKFDSIFDSFSQVEDHKNRQASGTGLGLTVTKQLVELHGGSITVESEVGNGSRFSFSMPVTDKPVEDSSFSLSLESVPVSKVQDYGQPVGQETIRPTVIDSEASERFQRMREEMSAEEFRKNSEFKILIVDDEAVNRQVLLNQLRMQNYQTVEASSGQEALEAVEREGDIDIILLDIMMPKMSGYDVCSLLRKKYPVQDLPIIFLTAKNLISDLVDGFEVGANDFLTKPISNSELTSRVRTHLQLLDISRNLDEKVKLRTHELEALDGIVALMNQEVKLDRLLEVILNEALTLFPTADQAAYWKLDKHNGYFELMSTQYVARGEDLKVCMPKSEIEKYYLNSKFEIRQDIYFIKDQEMHAAGIMPGQVPLFRSMVAIAMRLEGDLIGTLVLASKSNADAFHERQSVTFERFQTHLISALTKARLLDKLEDQCTHLEQVSLTDQLTGLRNRRYLFKYLDPDIALIKRKRYSHKRLMQSAAMREMKASIRESKDDSLIFFIVDIDHFKQINDRYGHTAGDAVLVQMKSIFQQVFRESDYLVRWGGEEFIAVARFCDREGAAHVAERLREAMEIYEFDIGDGEVIRNTCSIGFACYPFLYDEPEVMSWTQVVDVADHCLFAAKKTQRNAWVGLAGTTNSTHEQLFKHIVEYPEQLILNGEIEVETNIPEEKPLLWK